MNRYIILTAVLFSTALSVFSGRKKPQRTTSAGKPTILSELKRRHYDSIKVIMLPDSLGDTTIGPGNFVATHDVVIRAGRTTAIAGRTRIMFEPGRRLFVNGTLLAHNTSAGKIRLSHTPLSERANKIPIADSLWGGIILQPGSSLMLNHTWLSYAAVGITIGNGVRQVDLACVNMSRGTEYPIVSSDKPVEVENINCVSTADLPHKPLVSPFSPPKINSDKNSDLTNGLKALRIGSCLLTAGGLGTGAYGIYRYQKYGRKYEEADNPSENSSAQVDRYKKKATAGGWIGLAGVISGLIGSALFTFTFTF